MRISLNQFGRIPRIRRVMRAGFSLVELLVTVAVIALLVAITLPTMANARQYARTVVCGTRMKAIQAATHHYAHDHAGFLPREFKIKKNFLSIGDLAKGKLLNTPTYGIQTVMVPYLAAEAWEDPSDLGDAVVSTPVHERKGSSYEIKGTRHDPSKGKSGKDQYWQEMDKRKELVKDPFEPWKAQDPAEVFHAILNGELAPIEWHGRFYNVGMYDGHVSTVTSKAEKDALKAD